MVVAWIRCRVSHLVTSSCCAPLRIFRIGIVHLSRPARLCMVARILALVWVRRWLEYLIVSWDCIVSSMCCRRL